MHKASIGLFDSGVGGMTVLQALQKCLPRENYVYLGDTARLPYGTKSAETIIKYAIQATQKLVERDIKILVVACNTASSVALPALRKQYPHMNVIGVVGPGARAACNASKTGKIAVIATESTIRGEAYTRAIHKIRPNAKIYAKACPLFVPLAEDGLLEGPLVEGLVAHYLADIFEKEDKPDCLVLGCTHFPLLKASIQKVVGDDVILVDSAETTAQVVRNIILENATENENGGECTFLTTDDVERFAFMGERFLGIKPHKVELVDL